MRTYTSFLSLVMAAVLAATASGQDAHQVIAHPTVPVSSIDAKDLSLLFLKKVTTYDKWGNAQKAVPFDLALPGPRESFSKAVHGKPLTAIKAYWQQQIFSGRGTPPPELASDADVLTAIARTPGAIGYVSSGAALGPGVKLVRVTR